MFAYIPLMLVVICQVAGNIFPSYGQQAPDPLYNHFLQAAGQDGQIDAYELQQALTASGIQGSYQSFSRDVCIVLIQMLDRDFSGMMGFHEYKELWDALNQWKQTFMYFDKDRSGTIEASELHHALVSFGYRLSPQAIAVILRRFSVNGRVAFDAFIYSVARLRGLTDHFSRRDTERNAKATFQYDDFIQVTMGM